ncbi:FBD-associated F-box protein At4g10400-like [Abrus precatorius]|uniref:FBD-associated F-box protein At4g10400-like n=1 Tax=Abrus precatorius TaxID=3816 RepID=A0A8B8L0R4_ABRPR|nr:FBD-associated F-box protein At4g10400-like [Abrus precatorius]
MRDLISTLPDAVLCYILSFLPTRDAVATSLLSKRWETLWLSVPILDINDDTYHQNDMPLPCFVKFAYAAILALGVHQSVKRFCLLCEAYDDEPSFSDFNLWVRTAIRHGIEHLHLQMSFSVRLNLPCYIFSLKTLVVLKLNGLSVDSFSSVDLPSLKTLHLNRVNILEPRYFVNLLNGCPILEDLEAKNIDFKILSDINSEGDFKILSNLVRADISQLNMFSVPLKVICNVGFLRIQKELITNFQVFPNLTQLELMIEGFVNLTFVFETLKRCPKLESFVLGETRYTDPIEEQVLPNPFIVPAFISSQLKKCCFVNYMGKEASLLLAKYIMQNSRALRTMKICSAIPSNTWQKLEMLKQLSLCPRSSATCELLFE